MFIAKRHIPRRLFLKSAGCTLALPLLDAMIPASSALAQTAAAAKPRFMGLNRRRARRDRTTGWLPPT